MLNHIDIVFKESKTPWFRARGYHEYGVMRPLVCQHVDLDAARVLDFGCGSLPIAAASVALRHPGASVYGTDVAIVDEARLRAVLKSEASLDFPDNLYLHSGSSSELPGNIDGMDLIYSWSVFEHIPEQEIVSCFQSIRERLAPEGIFFFQIGGLYFSNEGSHLAHYFPEKNWEHLEYSLHELQAHVAGSSRPDATKADEWKQFVELNRLTEGDFLDAARDAGLKIVWQDSFRKGEPTAKLLRAYTASALQTFETRVIFKAL